MSKQPEYGKFPADALEEVVQKGVSRMVHPNTAILLRFKGLTDDSGGKKETAPKTPDTNVEGVKVAETPKKVVKSRKKRK